MPHKEPERFIYLLYRQCNLFISQRTEFICKIYKDAEDIIILSKGFPGESVQKSNDCYQDTVLHTGFRTDYLQAKNGSNNCPPWFVSQNEPTPFATSVFSQKSILLI